MTTDQIQKLKDIGPGDAKMVIGLLKRPDCSFDFDGAYQTIVHDFIF